MTNLAPSETAINRALTAIPLHEPGTSWQFPSDHLPVAAVVSGVRIGCWNVLNRQWVRYFRANAEGLNESALITDDVPLKAGEPLTRREERVINIISEMIPKLDVLCLQECDPLFLKEMQKHLPEKWEILYGGSRQEGNDIVILFDSAKISPVREESILNSDAYECREYKPLMDVLFLSSNGRLRLIHSHVPGDPKLPGIDEFASYVSRYRSITSEPVVAVGDLNFPQFRVDESFGRFGLRDALSLIKRNTTIGGDRCPKGIDHIIVVNRCISRAKEISPESLSREAACLNSILNFGRQF